MIQPLWFDLTIFTPCVKMVKPGASGAFSAVLSTEGRVVGLCWAKLKPKGPKGRAGLVISKFSLEWGSERIGKGGGQEGRKDEVGVRSWAASACSLLQNAR